VKDRPVMMHRFPNGIGERGFYQKDVPDYSPTWIKTVRVRKEAGGTCYNPRSERRPRLCGCR